MRRTLAGAALTLSLWATGAVAQSVAVAQPSAVTERGAVAQSSPVAQGGAQFAVDPAMTKGRATAPVTIVEFSDYQ